MTQTPKSASELTRLAEHVSQHLIAFYGEPDWRNPLPPLDELVSTILSQNTNDRNRDRAYHNLRQRFASWEDVRDAEQSEVIAAIRTAGLANQKGARIQQILREITQERGSLDITFLKAYEPAEAQEWLLKFKGVGRKTAAIVLLFSLGLPSFPVDTHIHRVTGRLGLKPESMTADESHDHLARLFHEEMYKTIHLNLIRLGREICHPRNPECVRCPLKDICQYARHNTPNKK